MSESKSVTNAQRHEALLLRADAAAELLGISKAHFYRMHNAGKVPMPVRLGGSVRWRRAELESWIAVGMPSRSKWLAMLGQSEGGMA